MIYGDNYTKLEKIGIIDIVNEVMIDSKTLHSKGYMDLNIEVLDRNESTADISLAHYFDQNGDLMADPEMTLRINKKMKMVEVLTYRMDSLGLEQYVYKTENGQRLVNLGLKKQLNDFLGQWLTNLINQKFNNE